MGYEITRFDEVVCNDLICPICTDVMNDPVVAPFCEHAFCRACITHWLTITEKCPMDYSALVNEELLSPPRILRNLLADLLIRCDYASQGCMVFVKLEALNSHTKLCEYNPLLPMPCERNCGTILPRGELRDHNCVQALKMELSQLKHAWELESYSYKQELCQLRFEFEELKQELQQKSMSQLQDSEIAWWWKLEKEQWAVIGMVPSFGPVPDNFENYLKQSGCPENQLKHFVQCKCPRSCIHTCGLERFKGYPANFRHFHNSKVCLALSCENKHLPKENAIPDPGFVFIT